MPERQHTPTTPGPWRVAEHIDANDTMLPLALHIEHEHEREDGSVRCVARAFPNLYENRADDLAAETEANARLIASAPAMRAALERIHDSDKHAGGTFVLELQQIARAALALADGAS